MAEWRNELLLEEWKACEGTIRNLDNILANIRYYGITITIGLMSAAAGLIKDNPTVRVKFSCSTYVIGVSSIIALLSTFFVVVLWILHEHYLQLMLLVVHRQRDIEEKELLVDGSGVIKLGGSVTRKSMPRLIRDPWNSLFALLIIIGIVQIAAYSMLV